MLAILERLFGELNRVGVRYCCWKDTAYLEEMLQGRSDVDLLLDDGQHALFDEVVANLGFQPAAQAGHLNLKQYHHYFGMDDSTGTLVHLDVKDDLVVGGSLFKNYHLPLESMVFENLDSSGPVLMPSRGTELLLYVIRKLLESASPLEHILLYRKYVDVEKQIAWLVSSESCVEAEGLRARYLPEVDPELLHRAIAALRCRAAILARWRLGQRLERMLAGYRRRSFLLAECMRGEQFAFALYHKFVLKRRSLRLAPRAAVVAVVGPDGSGKSTIVREMAGWLGTDLAVVTMHLGYPPPTALTVAPKKLSRLTRRVGRWAHSYSGAGVEGSAASAKRGGQRFLDAYFLAGRSLSLVYERGRLLARAKRLASEGVVVITDRYPTDGRGWITDSAQLDPEALAQEGHTLASRLAHLEHKLYRLLPPPDVAIILRVPLDLSLHRNRTRNKSGGPEPEEFLRQSHAGFARVQFPRSTTFEVHTDRLLEDTLLEVKRRIWAGLQSAPAPTARR